MSRHKASIKLRTIKLQLQQLMHYPTEADPSGEYLTLDEAFDELLRGFRLYVQRRNVCSYRAVHAAMERAAMSEEMADLFTDYCIKGWKVI